jgi:hypothetical protein
MFKLKRLGSAWRFSRPVIVAFIGLALLVILVGWRLGSAPAGLTGAEKSAVASSNLTALSSNPFFAPWKLIEDLFIHFLPLDQRLVWQTDCFFNYFDFGQHTTVFTAI